MAITSERLQELWSNPGHREQRLASMQASQTPEVIAKRRNSLKKAWAQGKYIKRISGGQRKGTIHTQYRLTPEGLLVKQAAMKKISAKARAEGKTGWPGGRLPTAEHRRKNSEGVRAAIVEGRFVPGHNIRVFIANGASQTYLDTRCNHGTHGSFYSKKNRQRLHYDSSWELRRMEFLEASTDVIRFSKNAVQLPYKFEGCAHSFFPDLLIEYTSGEKVLEEIKPKWASRLLVAKKKFTTARRFCRLNGWIFRVLSCKEHLSSR